MNKAIVSGNVGRDPEVRFTQAGQAVCNFSVANTRRWTKDGEKKEETTWVEIETWGKTAESVGKYLSKGSKVLVLGRLKLHEWEKDGQKRSRMVVSADDVEFLDTKKKEGEEHPNVTTAKEELAKGAEQEPQQGDIPF